MLELKGVIPALTTPFREDRSLDLDGFRELVETVIADGVHGIVPNGCTGESWALDDDERAAVFKATVEQTAGRVPVVPGCGAMSAKAAIAKIRQAEKAGCDAVMVQPPWYVMPSESDVYDYYKEIIGASELPVMVYNIPRRTGINLSLDLVDRLADEPKVIAIKESSKDWLFLSQVIRRVSGRINVLSGFANLLGLAAITEGAVGYVDSSTPVLGRRSVDFYEAAISGDTTRARPMQKAMANLNAGFFGVGTFPAGIKVALDMLGRPGGWPRDPIKPLDAGQREQIRDVLVAAGLLDDAGDQRATA